MCTLIVQYRIDETTPLRVAANRDEQLDRPAAPPAIRVLSTMHALAPLDLRGHGTWIGLNARGVFAGITNRFSAPRHPRRPSRGGIVTRALEASTATEAYTMLLGVDAAVHNGFHLVLADRRDAFVLKGDGQNLESWRLEPGTIVVTERSFGGGQTAREPFVLQHLAELESGGPPTLETMASLLRLEAQPSFEGSLVHMPELGYGTRSSTLIELGADHRSARFLHAEGRPDRTAFVDYTDLIAKLGAQDGKP